MENTIIKNRLTSLRKRMKDKKMDFYLIPTDDFHGSEYVADYFKVREYYSNFTGDNATLVISEKEAALWVDGRFFIQADHELEGTGVTPYHMMEEGVPSLEEYLKEKTKGGATIAFDGRCMDASTGCKLEELLKDNQIKWLYDQDAAGELWENRPELPNNDIFVLPDEISGKTTAEKLNDTRKKMEEYDAKEFLLTKLDDIMWLLNIRGKDIECNPVALSYLYITNDEVFFFVQTSECTEEVRKYLANNNIVIKNYDDILSFVKDRKYAGKVLLDKKTVNFALYKNVSERTTVVDKENPTELMKAIKNSIELEKLKDIYIKDSAAVVKFIYWLKKNVGKIPMTEITASDYLDNLRTQIPGYLDLSFPTISGYKENAAMMHYSATPDNFKEVEADGMLLVDSGGQYMGGTTDVTRTIVLGQITDEMKLHFSKVAAGTLQLADAHFLYGCTGRNVDILARQPLWDIGIDYKCGTGHGVGYILNVHEGPQNIRWKFSGNMVESVLEEGMIISDEPGVYIEGSHGIRTENVILVKKGTKNSDGQFMEFETLTYVPIDRDALDKKYLTPKDIDRINAYHKKVYEVISPLLTADEKEWLKEVTKEL